MMKATKYNLYLQNVKEWEYVIAEKGNTQVKKKKKKLTWLMLFTVETSCWPTTIWGTTHPNVPLLSCRFNKNWSLSVFVHVIAIIRHVKVVDIFAWNKCGIKSKKSWILWKSHFHSLKHNHCSSQLNSNISVRCSTNWLLHEDEWRDPYVPFCLV